MREAPPKSHPSASFVVALTASLGLIVGCPAAPGPADAGAVAATPAGDAGSTQSGPKQTGPKRPPYPNMATAAYGQEVLEQRLRGLAPGEAKIAGVLEALHELSPGSEQRAQDLAVRAYKSAKTDPERGTAVALFAAALALEPTAQGYKERVTDAYGVAAYAATLDASDAVGQGARALVNASAGAIAQADRLVQVVSDTPHVTGEARVFLGLARRVTSTWPLDRVVEDLQEALKARPKSVRVRAVLAEIFLDLGFTEDALVIVESPDVKDATGARPPWIIALHGRALTVQGDVAQGVALLREAEAKLDEGHRGDALYWLGRSLTQTDAWATEVPPIAASLATREGFIKEARTLEALVALLSGDAKKAVDIIKALASGAPRLPVDTDIAWLAVDACAGAGDAACVEEIGKRAVSLDGDGARLFRARATALTRTGSDAGVDAAAAARIEEANTQASRLAPFDDPVATRRLRAARKASVRGGAALARAALAPHVKGCRVCYAVLANAQSGKDAADSALAALAVPEAASPPLADADLITVIDALGAVADAKTKAALDTLAKDPREQIKKAVTQARDDHKDPSARERREKDPHNHGPLPGRDPGVVP